MIEIVATIEGVSPLLMHAVERFLDPFDDLARDFRRLGKKRAKSDDEIRTLMDMEWDLGIRINAEGKPIIRGEQFEAAIFAAAARERQKKNAQPGVFVDDAVVIHDGPTAIEKLRSDKRFRDIRAVRVQQARILRTRPRFDTWSAAVSITVIPDIVNPDDVLRFLGNAGMAVGVGDYRPKFGRFRVVKATQSKKELANAG